MTDPLLRLRKMVRLEPFSTRYHAVNLLSDFAGIVTEMDPSITSVPSLARYFFRIGQFVVSA